MDSEVQVDSRAERIQECFRMWDIDGKGYISKQDMKAVLTGLMSHSGDLTMEEIDQLMSEADRNGNGRIEYTEFLEWLTRPGSTVHAGAEDISVFNLEELLRPLFAVYDQNGDGAISREEFVECHNILQTALTLHPADGAAPDPEILSADARKVFKEADSNSDQEMSFAEFVTWQRDALARSGLLNDDLVELIPALTRQLQRVFQLAESNKTADMVDFDKQVLMHITNNVANFTRDLYNKDEARRNSLQGRAEYENVWSDPPIGLNLDRVKGLHLSTAAVPVWGVDRMDVHTLCIPEFRREGETTAGGAKRRKWLARVIRKVKYRTGRVEVDEPVYYSFQKLIWSRSPGLEEAFRRSYDGMSPEMRIFCHIKSAANFGVQLSWKGLQVAFRSCIEEGLLTDLQVAFYNKHVEESVTKTIRERGASGTESERFYSLLTQAPRSIMATFGQLGILRVESLLADVRPPRC